MWPVSAPIVLLTEQHMHLNRNQDSCLGFHLKYTSN